MFTSFFLIAGLERVAEELMGRRKWKQYQDIIQRSNLNIDATNLTQKTTSPVGKSSMYSFLKIVKKVAKCAHTFKISVAKSI